MNDRRWTAVEAYFDEKLVGPDAVLEHALRASAAAGLPEIQVSASQGKFLYLLAVSVQARRILEIGTLGGYSTLWLARALPPDGRLLSLELEPHHATVARQNIAHGGMSDRVEILVGPALASLARLKSQPVAPFDLVFIDADKTSNLDYVQAALSMSHVGTLIIVDNVVRDGEIISRHRDEAAEGVRRMTEWIADEARLSATVIQTVGNKGYDGFLLARVQSAAS